MPVPPLPTLHPAMAFDEAARAVLDYLRQRIAPDITAVPAYAEAPGAQEIGLVAYAGMPITEADGGLFGVLCGLSTGPVVKRGRRQDRTSAA